MNRIAARKGAICLMTFAATLGGAAESMDSIPSTSSYGPIRVVELDDAAVGRGALEADPSINAITLATAYEIERVSRSSERFTEKNSRAVQPIPLTDRLWAWIRGVFGAERQKEESKNDGISEMQGQSLALMAGSVGEFLWFVYDANGRLVQYRSFLGSDPEVVDAYQYDNADNRTQRVITGSPNLPP